MSTSQSNRQGEYLEAAYFIQNNRNVHAEFGKHLGAFTAFDASLDSGYADLWQKAIIEFEDHPSDELMRDEIQVFTDEVTAQQKVCWAAMDDLEYYVKRAFPGSKRKLLEFGFSKNQHQRERNALHLVFDIEVMLQIADDYNSELSAAGMPAGIITNLQQQQDKLLKTEKKQEYQKRLRIRATGKRIELYNTVYGYFVRVRDAAHVIYRNAEETMKLFEMGGELEKED